MNLVPDCVHWGGQQLVPLVRLRDLDQVTLPEHLLHTAIRV